MTISVEDIKKLRDATGAGMMDAKKALVEAQGNAERATEILRLSGQAKAVKKAEREAKSGLIEAYVHGGRIGVLVEVNCETDFVARTDDFKEFAHDIAMHVAATSPEYINPDEVPADVISKERNLYLEELASTAAAAKPAEVKEKIISGKLEKYFEGICLVRQPFVKDPSKSIDDLTKELIGKLGENIVIRRFERLELGQIDG